MPHSDVLTSVENELGICLNATNKRNQPPPKQHKNTLRSMFLNKHFCVERISCAAQYLSREVSKQLPTTQTKKRQKFALYLAFHISSQSFSYLFHWYSFADITLNCKGITPRFCHFSTCSGRAFRGHTKQPTVTSITVDPSSTAPPKGFRAFIINTIHAFQIKLPLGDSS